MPAALAAATPAGASSTTAQCRGVTPNRSAAIKNTCGSGLPRVTSSPVTTARNSSRVPSLSRTRFDVLRRGGRSDGEPEARPVERLEQFARARHGGEVGLDRAAEGRLLAPVQLGDLGVVVAAFAPEVGDNLAAGASEGPGKVGLAEMDPFRLGHFQPTVVVRRYVSTSTPSMSKITAKLSFTAVQTPRGCSG